MHCDLNPVLTSIKDEVLSIFGKDVDLILVGSSARGEFTGYQLDAMIESYSDIELILITRKAPIIRHRLAVQLRSKLILVTNRYFLKTGYEGIDIWPMSPRFFQSQSSVFFAEARASGKVLINGLKIFNNRSCSISLEDLREIILHRAINMTSARNKHHHQFRLQYSISRNFLDIITVYSWYHGLHMTTYRDRLQVLSAIAVSDELSKEYQLSLEHKLDPKNSQIRPVSERLQLYWSELGKLADCLDIWNQENSINYSQNKLYVHKFLYWFRNKNLFRLRHVFKCQKKELLTLLIDIGEKDDCKIRCTNSLTKFGLKEEFLKGNQVTFFDGLDKIFKFHYPYLNKK